MGILVNTGPGNGLLPDGTKPLPEPVLTYDQYVLWHLHERSFHDINTENQRLSI